MFSELEEPPRIHTVDEMYCLILHHVVYTITTELYRVALFYYVTVIDTFQGGYNHSA
jgi:hypothetical protein